MPVRSQSTTATSNLSIARALAENPTRWGITPRFDPVQRWYHRLPVPESLDEPREAWLLTWLPGQETDLHDHGGSAGAFVVVAGMLTERTPRYDGPQTGDDEGRPTRLVETRLVTGAGRSFGPRHIHQVTNQGTRPAISLHVYSPSLSTMTRYRIEDGVLRVLAVDRAGAQW